MTAFEPVRTLAELDELDPQDMEEGYRTAERGDRNPARTGTALSGTDGGAQ
jgi:hypothetical protein